MASPRDHGEDVAAALSLAPLSSTNGTREVPFEAIKLHIILWGTGCKKKKKRKQSKGNAGIWIPLNFISFLFF